jgi:predicted amidohydrolase
MEENFFGNIRLLVGTRTKDPNEQTRIQDVTGKCIFGENISEIAPQVTPIYPPKKSKRETPNQMTVQNLRRMIVEACSNGTQVIISPEFSFYVDPVENPLVEPLVFSENNEVIGGNQEIRDSIETAKITAREKNVHIVLSSVCEKIQDEEQGTLLCNTTVVIHPEGNFMLRRKAHDMYWFPPGSNEWKSITDDHILLWLKQHKTAGIPERTMQWVEEVTANSISQSWTTDGNKYGVLVCSEASDNEFVKRLGPDITTLLVPMVEGGGITEQNKRQIAIGRLGKLVYLLNSTGKASVKEIVIVNRAEGTFKGIRTPQGTLSTVTFQG